MTVQALHCQILSIKYKLTFKIHFGVGVPMSCNVWDKLFNSLISLSYIMFMDSCYLDYAAKYILTGFFLCTSVEGFFCICFCHN
uniref:Putative aarF domain-containing protein kinase At1g79600ic isoform X2 n=1 Tax=Rhizophora mucronata TaxID=61149 RepID=A0A2P2M2A8_RHIMU